MTASARLVAALRNAWTASLLGVLALVLAALVVRAGQDDGRPDVASAPTSSPSAVTHAAEPSAPPADAAALAAQASLVLDAELADLDCADREQARDWTCLYDDVEPDSTQSVRIVLVVPVTGWSTSLDAQETAREAGRGAMRLLAPQVPHLDRVVVGERGNDGVTVSRRTVVGAG